MRRTNINAMLKMVKEFLDGEIGTTTFTLDFPYEMERRMAKMQKEDTDFADMMYFYLIECGTDKQGQLTSDEFRKLINQQYEEVLDGVY